MKLPSLSIAAALLVSACAKTAPVAEPYVSVPLADLVTNSQLIVYGNGMGWAMRYNEDTWSKNKNGPRLQGFITTDIDGQYVAVFRNFDQSIEYGRATFTMPTNATPVTGVTDLGYEFSITRNDENTLVYTLSGLFTIDLEPGGSTDLYAGGGFATGSYTGDDAMDLLSGSATFSGNFIGTSTFADLVTGDVSLTVNFDANNDQVSGDITNLTGGSYEFNDLIISATFVPESSFEGVLDIVPVTNGVFSFGERGQIKGGFYGPGADEFGATIRIANGENHILSGAISGAVVP